MRGKISNYHSADILEVWTWEPSSIADVHFGLSISIGPPDEIGADDFQVIVASPEALRKDCRDNAVIGRHYLIVLDYSWEVLERELEKILDVCEADTWERVREKLCRYFLWEYEDYKMEEE